MFTFIVMRHGEKSGDALTGKGRDQVRAMAGILADLHGLRPTAFFYSGLNRALETARIVAEGLVLDAEPSQDSAFDFNPTIKRLYGDNPKKFLADAKLVAERDGPTLGHAFRAAETHEFANQGCMALEEGMVRIAKTLEAQGHTTAFAASHSPWTELAHVRPNEIPFGLPEASVVVYKIDTKNEGKIVDSVYIALPGAGGSNV
jgi:broad specificity phosphatase PhoE